MRTTKEDMVLFLSTELTSQKTEAEKFLNAYYKIVGDLLKNGKEVPLTGLGKLKPVTRAARRGRNPQTGEAINIPEKKDVKLVLAKNFKEYLK